MFVADCIAGFLLRVWVKFSEEDWEGNEKHLAFEKNVELFDLSYLGLMVEGEREEREE